MTIYHVEFAKIGHTLTGGEVCMVELIKYFESIGYKNVLLTTDNGKETYSHEIPENTLLEYRTISSYSRERRFGVLVSYVLRVFPALRLARTVTLTSDDVVICHSDFFPNSIPAWLIIRQNPQAKSVGFFHMKAPRLWRGYAGEFTGKLALPALTVIHYRLNQWLYRLLMSPPTLIATVNAYYVDYLQRKFPGNRIQVLRHFGGMNGEASHSAKQYDVVWIGRFHAQKGLHDLAQVIHEVLRSKPEASFLVIGDGPVKVKQRFIEELISLGVRDSVCLAGFVGGKEKFGLLAQSRVFAMTSHYESFGIVILEAMASNVPVVAYDLPVYDVFKDGIIRVPLLNYRAMALQIVRLLDDVALYEQTKKKASTIAADHSWPMTGQELLEAIHA